MRSYTFEITLTEDMLDGDEFWEGCLDEDPSGQKPLTETVKELIINSNLIYGHEDKIDKVVKLTKVTNV